MPIGIFLLLLTRAIIYTQVGDSAVKILSIAYVATNVAPFLPQVTDEGLS
jgi:hypothetical protein